MSAVPREHRFSKANQCPVCGGFDGAARGQGIRCHGFLSDNEEWANCSREEHSGSLLVNPDSGTYGHRVSGPCPCGAHHSAASPAAVADRLGEPEAVYSYRDETGAVLFEVCRFADKQFRQRRAPAAGTFAWNLTGVRRVLYRLPETRRAITAGATVYVVEGEKDADALAALGLAATTNPQGAGKWSEDYTASLAGASRVVILPDNDQPGREHAQRVARSLCAAGMEVRLLELDGLPERGDVSDWLRRGGNCGQLEQLAMAAPQWASDRPAGKSFADMLRTPPKGPEWQIDRLCERGDMLMLGGPPSSGKSFLGLAFCLSVATGRRVWDGFDVKEAGRVVYLDAEMGERRMTRRAHRLARGLGIGADDLENRAHFLPGAFPLEDSERFDTLRDQLTRFRGRGAVDLLVFDTMRRFMGGEEQDSGAVSRYFGLVRELQVALGGPTILLLHHTRKASKQDGPEPLDRFRGSIDIPGNLDSGLLVDGRKDGLLRILNPKSRERELTPFAVRIDGWDQDTASEEDYTSPLRLVHEGSAATAMAQGHALQAAIVAFLEAQPGRRALRIDVIAALKSKGSTRAISNAFSALKLARVADSQVGATNRGKAATWYLVDPVAGLRFEEGFQRG